MNDLKVSDIMCKWYIWAVVGYVIKMIDNFQLAS